MAVISRKAVLFDLDGTVVDTAPDLAGAANDMRISRGLSALPVDQLAPWCSYGGRGMLAEAFAIAPSDDGYRAMYDEFIATYRQRMTRDSSAYPGIRELLGELRDQGIDWGIVTNKPEALAVPLIQHLAFDPPPGAIVGGDTAGVAKPDPAPIQLACRWMDINPAHCVYVGDSDRDIAAGQAAGMATIAAGYGYIPANESAADWPADILAARVADLAPAIATLLARVEA